MTEKEYKDIYLNKNEAFEIMKMLWPITEQILVLIVDAAIQEREKKDLELAETYLFTYGEEPLN
jgi:hypothetical protein